jgi:hypothetical protein
MPDFVAPAKAGAQVVGHSAPSANRAAELNPPFSGRESFVNIDS